MDCSTYGASNNPDGRDIKLGENANTGEQLELTANLALRAYAIGVFPMAEEKDCETVFWVDPRTRGILPLENFKVPRRLRRTIRNTSLKVRSDTAFDQVIDGCAEAAPSRGREDTWINPPIKKLFRELFDLGHAHTVECWNGDQLVGGLYGLSLGGAFFGESMFSRDRDASKIALVHLAARLQYGGFTLLDAQFPNPHLEQFGAKEITRSKFKVLLDKALDRPAQWPKSFPPESLDRFLKTLRN